jgi:NAD(P)-dependent dehydrogenase (short-subunit alcohol dehydrogenase family)
MPMSEDLTGKVAAVTGAARGIGRACAVRLAQAGADVAIIDIDLDSGARYEHEPAGTATEQIEGALGVQADLTDERQAHAAIAMVVEHFGRLDILVNAAGGAITPYTRSTPSKTPTEDVKTLFEVNFMSAFHSCQAAIPALKQAGGGAIINFTSTAATTVFPDGSNSAYAATKAALAHWTRHLAAEIGPDGIRVNMVAPGITLTGRLLEESRDTGYDSRAAEVPMRRLGRPDDVAKAVEFFASDLSAFVTGRSIPVDGGWILNPA